MTIAVLFHRGAYTEAKERLLEILERDPEHEPALARLEALRRRGSWPDSLRASRLASLEA